MSDKLSQTLKLSLVNCISCSEFISLSTVERDVDREAVGFLIRIVANFLKHAREIERTRQMTGWQRLSDIA
jgi:hypothetical protein